MSKLLCVLGVVALAGSAASADVIIGNYPFTNDSTLSAGLSNLRVKAISFTMPAGPGYTLDSVTLRLGNYDATDTVVAEIRSDNAGVPGAAVASIAMPAGQGAVITDYTGAPTAATVLAGATTYWIWVAGIAGGGTFDWRASSPAVPYTGAATFGLSRFSTNGGTSFTASTSLNTMSIDGTLVPAPASLGLLAIAGLVGLRRRR